MTTKSSFPIGGVMGGALIGGSTGVLLLFNGDIMGISGIMNNTLAKPIRSLTQSKDHWRWVYLAGFSSVVHVWVHFVIPGGVTVALKDTRSETGKDVFVPNFIAHVLGGLLVGMGTRLGNGCTTGHAMCGLGRLSPRSLVATCTFTGMSIVTRYIIAPMRSFSVGFSWLRSTEAMQSTGQQFSPLASALVVILTNAAACCSPQTLQSPNDLKKKVGAWLSGAMFAVGLGLSGMTKNSKVHDFLCLSGLNRETFDPTLIAVMASGILTSWLAYQVVPERSQICTAEQCLMAPIGTKDEDGFKNIPNNNVINTELLVGAIIFGIGWGLTGICPGPGLYLAAAGKVYAISGWVPAYCVGSLVGDKVKTKYFSPAAAAVATDAKAKVA